MSITLNSYSISATGILTIDANLVAPGGYYLKRYTVKWGAEFLDECRATWDYGYSASDSRYTWLKMSRTSGKRVSKIDLSVWPNGTLNLTLNAEYSSVVHDDNDPVTLTDTAVNITVENTFNIPLRAVVDTPEKFYTFSMAGSTPNYRLDEFSQPATLIFNVPSTAAPGAAVPVTLYAEDDNAVTGYLITETATKPLASDPRWQAVPPTEYTLSGGGTYRLYAWAVDADGNVSDPVSATVSAVTAQAGSFALPSITLQPVVSAPTLSGIQRGSFTAPAVTLRPVVTAPTLSGVQRGSFTMPTVTLTPTVTAPTLNGVSVVAGAGAFTLPAVTLRPIVTAPRLFGMTGGASIRAPSGQPLNLRRIDGTPFTILSI